MKIFNTIEGIQSEVRELKNNGLSIGFVPTMGALHKGHLSLLEHSLKETDVSISSIFVNPIQFNNKQDLLKYPRTLEEDCEKLEKAGCQIVFAPSVEEMYPEKDVKEHYDFGSLEQVMEGEHRPGHFSGVAVVVKRLFEICLPDKAYFGEKDFQQLMVIRALVRKEGLPVDVIGCPIIREGDGLAMSSRNVRLTKTERTIAPEIFKTLHFVRRQQGMGSVHLILQHAKDKLNAQPGIDVEYLSIVDESTLQPVDSWEETENLRVFVAAFLGEVRLIDNLRLTET